MKPFADFVVVREVRNSTVSPGGIHLPETAKQSSCRGHVIAAGPDAPVDLGALVHYPTFSGYDLDVNGDRLRALRLKELIFRE